MGLSGAVVVVGVVVVVVVVVVVGVVGVVVVAVVAVVVVVGAAFGLPCVVFGDEVAVVFAPPCVVVVVVVVVVVGVVGDDAWVLEPPCVWAAGGPALTGAPFGPANAVAAVSVRIVAMLIGSSRSRMLVSSGRMEEASGMPKRFAS